MTDDTLYVTDLLEFTDSFLLELPKAGEIEIESEKEVFLITGSRKKFEPPQRIKTTSEQKIKKIDARHDKFGIITHQSVDLNGTRSYQVERYQVKGKKKVTLKKSETSGEVLVFRKGEDKQLVPLVLTYVEKVNCNSRALKH